MFIYIYVELLQFLVDVDSCKIGINKNKRYQPKKVG